MRLHDKAMRRVAMFSLGLLGVALAAPVAAIDVFIRGASYTETMPDGAIVTMWGYSVGATETEALAAPLSSPGPAITVPAGQSQLRVTLINQLPVPTSFVLHGHNTAMTPVFARMSDDTVCTPDASPANGTMPALVAFRDCRMRSFTHEVAAPTTAAPSPSAVYEYANVRPGTYLYQSGTMPQIQVQMGLYGMVRKNFAEVDTSGTTYAYPTLPFDNQISVLLSEVDPTVHSAVASGTFTGSTIGYDPKYFRLHHYNPPGAACATGTVASCLTPPTPFTEHSLQSALPITAGKRQLVRLVNAGIQSRALELISGHWYLVAEDGNTFPQRREQHSAFLPAAKTADVWFTPTTSTSTNPIDWQLTIFDRRMALTNNNADPSGGQLLRLNFQ